MPIFRKLNSGNLKNIVENLLSLSILNIVNYVFPLIIIPILIKRLGIENYGVYIFAYTILNYLNLVVQYGFNFSATNKIAKNQQDNILISTVYSSVTVIRLILSGVLIAGLIIGYIIEPKLMAMYLLGAGIFVGQGLIPVWLFQGLERMKFITIINFVVRLVAFILIYVLVNHSSDIWLLMGIQSLSFMLGAIVAMVIAYKDFNLRLFIPTVGQLKIELVEGWQLFLSTIGMNFYRESNIIILGLITNFTVVGYYAPAEKLIKAVQSFSNIIVTALYPYFSKTFGKNKENAIEVFKKTGNYLGAFFAIISIIICASSSLIIQLYLGKNIMNTTTDLRILSFVILFGGLNYFYGIIGLVNKGLERYFTKAVWISGITSIFFCAIFSFFWGDLGAALSMLLAEILLLIIVYFKSINK